jgi:hypothetical protein
MGNGETESCKTSKSRGREKFDGQDAFQGKISPAKKVTTAEV